jgi:ATP synthase I chain.
VRDVADGLEVRLLRSMIATVVVAAGICAFVAPWRITSGVILGGGLSILNYRWLHTSVAAIFDINLASERPRAGVSRYILRYLVVGALVFAAVNLQIVSLPATLAGLAAFVPALFVEALREFYFAIFHREEPF